MGTGQLVLKKRLLDNCLNWFQSHFKQYVENPITQQFPNFLAPAEVLAVIDRS